MQEYKKYHTEDAKIHGPSKVNELETNELETNELETNEDQNRTQDMVMNTSVDEEAIVTPKDSGGNEVPDFKSTVPGTKSKVSDTTSDVTPNVQGPSLQTINPWDGLDPSVKELVISWYWAGYYQGYYNGKRDGAQG